MIAVLGGLADFERDLIRALTVEGRARAKARGVKFGPEFKLTPDERKEALARRAAADTTTALDSGREAAHCSLHLRNTAPPPSSVESFSQIRIRDQSG
jgi:DNA invertase Pin-like site-specific DNA recombinase